VGRSQLEHGQEVCGVLFVSRSDPPEVFDAIEEPLDPVACAVERRAEAGFPAAMNHRRDVRRGTSGFNAPAQPIGIVSLVGEHDGIGLQPAEQMFGDRAVTCLARCQDQLERWGAANSSGKVGKYLMDLRLSSPMRLYPFRGPQTTSQIEDFRYGQFRKHYAAFKTSIKNDGWMTNFTGAPRRSSATNFHAYDPGPNGDWRPGTILNLVGNRKYAGATLRKPSGAIPPSTSQARRSSKKWPPNEPIPLH
jgi:hypothetical protein